MLGHSTVIKRLKQKVVLLRLLRAVQKRLSYRRLLVLAALGGLSVAVVLGAANIYVALVTRRQRFDDAVRVPPARVAIVFGAGVRPDGRLSPMLADRVGAAVELYRLGRVQKLLMTGDNSRVDYDEVSAMRRDAIARGVPSAAITLDFAGFRTYDSCYRARVIFGLTSATLVTQAYHLPRAVYTCRALGVAARGLGTPDWARYHAGVMVPYTLREVLATLNALWEVHVTRPTPMFLGQYEGLE